MNHDPSTCDLCLVGREDLCIIREKSISEFNNMKNRNVDWKDFETIKKERIEYQRKLSLIEKRSPT